MTSADDVQELQAALGRLRESVLFYLKLDFALLGAFAAVVTIFQLTLDVILSYSGFVIGVLTLWLWLTVGGLLLEFLITWTRNFPRVGDKIGLLVLQMSYFALVIGHIIVLVALLLNVRSLMSL